MKERENSSLQLELFNFISHSNARELCRRAYENPIKPRLWTMKTHEKYLTKNFVAIRSKAFIQLAKQYMMKFVLHEKV